MKKLFFAALIALAGFTACGTKNVETAATEATEQREVGGGDIAYVQVEAVLAQSDLYNAEGIALKDKTEKAQKSWAQKEQNFQYEVAQLQEKYQKGLITTNDAQSTQENIERRIASYQAAAQKEAKALDEENFVFSNRAQDLLHRAIENLNADGRYKLIVNANALLDADSTLDITPAVLQEVNRLYALEKKEKSAPLTRGPYLDKKVTALFQSRYFFPYTCSQINLSDAAGLVQPPSYLRIARNKKQSGPYKPY